MQAIVLFAHGARDPRWADPFQAVATRLRHLQPGVQVRLAFLEFMSPDLAAAAAELAALGCTQLQVLPLFLGAGGHVRKDLPVLVDALRSAHPAMAVELHAAAGEAPGVIDALAAVAAASLGARGAQRTEPE
ncbi:MAG: CbiX/SirB N-terminal domain-containing protein [Rubrivivax sp.]